MRSFEISLVSVASCLPVVCQHRNHQSAIYNCGWAMAKVKEGMYAESGYNKYLGKILSLPCWATYLPKAYVENIVLGLYCCYFKA